MPSNSSKCSCGHVYADHNDRGCSGQKKNYFRNGRTFTLVPCECRLFEHEKRQ